MFVCEWLHFVYFFFLLTRFRCLVLPKIERVQIWSLKFLYFIRCEKTHLYVQYESCFENGSIRLQYSENKEIDWFEPGVLSPQKTLHKIPFFMVIFHFSFFFLHFSSNKIYKLGTRKTFIDIFTVFMFFFYFVHIRVNTMFYCHLNFSFL